jgi:hypothetical protein
MSIKNNQTKGFITLTPALIISVVLFILTMQAYLDLTVMHYQYAGYSAKVQSNRVVDGCAQELAYKAKQLTLVTNTEWVGGVGEYSCRGTIFKQNNLWNIILKSTLFTATSGYTGSISAVHFTTESLEKF